MPDPIVEQVKYDWPNSLHLWVSQGLFFNDKQFKVHTITDNDTSTWKRLSNYLDGNVNLILAEISKSFPHDWSPFQHEITHTFYENDRLSRQLFELIHDLFAVEFVLFSYDFFCVIV